MTDSLSYYNFVQHSVSLKVYISQSAPLVITNTVKTHAENTLIFRQVQEIKPNYNFIPYQ